MLQWVHGSLAVVSDFCGLHRGHRTPQLQWVHGSLAVVSGFAGRQHRRGDVASMGPRLARRGIVNPLRGICHLICRFNGSTARSPWYRETVNAFVTVRLALQWVHGSLAVVSRFTTVLRVGDCPSFNGSTARSPWYREEGRIAAGEAVALQWVHGTLAVVSRALSAFDPLEVTLQWVHGTLAVVSLADWTVIEMSRDASMGPRHAGRGIVVMPGFRHRRGRGFNGSTARSPWYRKGCPSGPSPRKWLQWVHGTRAVVSDERKLRHSIPSSLQWVHGTLAVVSAMAFLNMARPPARFNGSTARSPWYRPGWRPQKSAACCASMGPRLARRGIAVRGRSYCLSRRRFNGSTARWPWYRWNSWSMASCRSRLQWVHGSLAVVSAVAGRGRVAGRSGLQWVHGSLAVVSDDTLRRAPKIYHSFNGSTARAPWYRARTGRFRNR